MSDGRIRTGAELMLMTRFRLSSPLLCASIFCAVRDGTMAIEAVSACPADAVFGRSHLIFDAFRMYNVNQKAAYTISDAIFSRQCAD
jgi:hypothetical protein